MSRAATASRTPSALIRFACCLSAVMAGLPSALPISPAHAEPELRVTRTPARLDPALQRGFDALTAGNLEAAEREYAGALKSSPNCRDALHGAAVVALRRNDRTRAEDFYRRAAAADPRDGFAIAGLAALNGYPDASAETRLKSLIAAQPDEASLHFALGNLYAASSRWRDAQDAFFSAYAAAPEQPDYLFNLAVSLDHLRQPKAARRFYEKALAAAARRPAAFDLALATARLRELTP
ncbi:MAG: tetratricopeptide repeat protein [Ignavibacteria bacterium]